MNTLRHLAAATSLVFGLASPAQAQLQCSGVTELPKIAGLYLDNFSGWHSIGKTAWLDFSDDRQFIFEVCSIDNAKHFLIAQNTASAPENIRKFSRFEWTEKDGQLAYCQQVFDAASAAEAADFSKYPAANSANFNDEGCGQNGKFAWTILGSVRR